MTQKTCKNCKSSIDAEATICPNCRSKQGAGWFKKLALIFFALIFFSYISNRMSGSSAPVTKTNTPDPTVVDHSLAYKTPDPSSDWSLHDSLDPMTGSTQKSMHLVSRNSLSLDFPYQGENKARLTVRQHPRHGLDVIFRVEKGQMLCNSSRCSVLVRFDDNKPIIFSGTESSDNSSRLIFINDTKRFIDQAKKATQILIQVDFFQNGVQMLEFESKDPLPWPPLKK